MVLSDFIGWIILLSRVVTVYWKIDTIKWEPCMQRGAFGEPRVKAGSCEANHLRYARTRSMSSSPSSADMGREPMCRRMWSSRISAMSPLMPPFDGGEQHQHVGAIAVFDEAALDGLHLAVNALGAIDELGAFATDPHVGLQSRSASQKILDTLRGYTTSNTS